MRRWARCSGSGQLRVEPGHLQGTVDPEQDLDPPMLTEEELVWSEVALWGGVRTGRDSYRARSPFRYTVIC